MRSIETLNLTWSGKDDAVKLSHSPCARNLKDCREKSCAPKGKNTRQSNLIIEGDNLDALKLLQDTYHSHIQAIYIDPPYNTGNAFVYHDAFEHAAWLNMMYPRLSIARDLLRDDGAIFISIDDNEVDKLRLILAEIFGEANFIAQITIQSNPRGRQAERHFARVHEYLLVYAKDATKCSLNGVPLTEDQLDEFDRTDAAGRRYRLLGLRQRGAHSLREDRPAMHYPIYVDPSSGNISFTSDTKHSVAVLPKKSTGQAGRWMWGKQRAEESLDLLEAKLIRGRNEWDIFVRDYVDDADGNNRRRKLKTIWDDKELNYQNGKRELKQLIGRAVVDYPKPTALLSKIIAMFDDQEALFMDFFAGSGTLGHAVLQMNKTDGGNRKFILIQIAERTEDEEFPTIADVCRERITRAIQSLEVESGFNYQQVV